MENRKIFKLFVFIITRAESFTRKIRAERDLGGYLVVLPFLLNLFSVFSFFDSDSIIVRKIFLYAFIPFAGIILIISLFLNYFLNRKDRYLSLKKRYQNDEYFNYLKKKGFIIDILLIINGFGWLIVLITANI